jgi:methylenetetrahydrofolate dehydrogenase (NADP+)/methenyltetrahydrofolate cyclohydrolase
VLSGKPVAEGVRADVGRRVADLWEQGHRVGLATVLVGEDPASQVYVGSKHRAAGKTGMGSFDHHLPATATQAQVHDLIHRLNEDPEVTAMIVQLPLPDHLDGHAAVAEIDPAKDADGLHPHNLGLVVLERPGPVPATPQGIMEMLRYYEIETAGRTAIVIGRSFLVGRPLSLLLGAKGADATVIQAHSRTRDLAALAATADILVAAVGRPRMITPEFVKPGATVVDVGINRTADGLVGDVDYDAVAEVAGAVTPVPGGVGLMTVACLLRNTVAAAEHAVG